jgi:hypothetical protein
MKHFGFILALSFSPAIADDITLIDSGALDWKSTPEGVAFAVLEGDRFAEA